MKELMRLAVVIFPLLTFVPAFAQKLPEGEGKALVDLVCSSCHGPDVIVAKHATLKEWTAIVEDMVARGANLTEKEQRTVIDYLARNFGPVERASEGGGKVHRLKPVPLRP